MSSEFISSIRAHSSELTLPVLQKADPAIRHVLYTAKHVAYYQLDKSTSQWIRQAVEGPLFIARRDSDDINASHCIFILNRKAMTNFSCYINRSLPIEVQDAYLMMQMSDGDVAGFWFYDRHELEQAEQCIKQIFEQQETQTNQTSNKIQPTNQQANQQANQSVNAPAQSKQVVQSKQSVQTIQQPSQSSNQSTNAPAVTSSQSSSSIQPQHTRQSIKPLHSKAPPAPVDLAPAMQSGNERQLQKRLNQLLMNIDHVDREHAAKHAEAVKSQIEPTRSINNNDNAIVNRSQSTTSSNQSTTNHHHVPLDQLFQSISMSSTSSSLPAMPASSTQANQPQFIDSATLERSLARNRQPNQHNVQPNRDQAQQSNNGLNSVVSAMFNQQPRYQQHQSINPVPVPPRGLTRDQYAHYLRSLLDRSDMIDYWFSQYQKSQQQSEQPALFFV